MTHSAEEESQILTPRDVSLAAELGKQVELLKQFLSGDKSLQKALSVCEWAIRPGDDGAPLLEIRCSSCGSWHLVLGKSIEIANQLQRAAGPKASVLIHRPQQLPDIRHPRYLFHLYREREQ